MQRTLDADLNVIQNSDIQVTVDPITADLNIIQKLDDEPNDVGGLSAQELKAKFDEAGNVIKTYINETLVPEVLSEGITEAQRQANETMRQTAETGRVQAETGRVSAEAARVQAESARAQAETARAQAEQGRTEEELLRGGAEGEREAAEGVRRMNESQRSRNESARESAEQARAAAETKRDAAERDRDENELYRMGREISRDEAESDREQAETQRASAESGRVQTESGRASAESARASAETARSSAETARASAETARQTAESARASAESARQTAESGRVQAEAQRESAQASFFQGVAAKAKTLVPGSNATAEAVRVGGSFRLDLGIPRGEPGLNGVALAADGVFAFNVDDNGHLILSYTGETAPEFELLDNGHLMAQVGQEQVDLGDVKGQSAYELAVEQGFQGTEEEWLESLKGESAIPPVTKNAIAQTLVVYSNETEPKFAPYVFNAVDTPVYVPNSIVRTKPPLYMKQSCLPSSDGTTGYVFTKTDSGASWMPPDGVPAGCIVIRSGAADAVPDGWALCNGENGTPELTVQGLSCLMKL